MTYRLKLEVYPFGVFFDFEDINKLEKFAETASVAYAGAEDSDAGLRMTIEIIRNKYCEAEENV